MRRLGKINLLPLLLPNNLLHQNPGLLTQQVRLAHGQAGQVIGLVQVLFHHHALVVKPRQMAICLYNPLLGRLLQQSKSLVRIILRFRCFQLAQRRIIKRLHISLLGLGQQNRQGLGTAACAAKLQPAVFRIGICSVLGCACRRLVLRLCLRFALLQNFYKPFGGSLVFVFNLCGLLRPVFRLYKIASYTVTVKVPIRHGQKGLFKAQFRCFFTPLCGLLSVQLSSRPFDIADGKLIHGLCIPLLGLLLQLSKLLGQLLRRLLRGLFLRHRLLFWLQSSRTMASCRLLRLLCRLLVFLYRRLHLLCWRCLLLFLCCLLTQLL